MQYRDSVQTLDEEERQVACRLWDELMFAPNLAALESARRELKKSPDRIQRALMNALVVELATGKRRERPENPFAPDAPAFSLNTFRPSPPPRDGIAPDGAVRDA